MALNRYSKLPKATIRNVQVLTDLGIIDTALQRKQAKYDAQANFNAQAIQGAETLPVFGKYDTEYKNKIAADIKNKVAEVSNKDLADPNVSGEVNQFIQQMSSDPRLAQAVQAKSMYDNFQKSREDLATKGKLPTSADKLRQKAWNDYSETGQLTADATEPLYENQNLIQGRGELVNMIKSSGHEGTALMSGRGYGVKSSGVSYDKIDKAVRAQLDAYANSPYGRQELDDWKVAKMEGTIPKDMKFGDYLLKGVMSTAQNYQYSNTSADYSSVINTLDDRAHAKKEKEEEKFNGEGYTPAMSTGNNVEIDSDGKYDQPWYMDAYDLGKEALTGEKSDSRTKEQKEMVARLEKQKEQVGFKGTTKEFAEQVFNKDVNVKVTYFSAKEAAEQSKKFWDGKTKGGTAINTRAWDEESGTWLPFNEFLEKNDISEEDAKEGFALVGKISPDNQLGTPTGTQAVVGGKSVILDTSSSKATAEELYVHEVSKARYNPERKHVFRMPDPQTGKLYEYTAVSPDGGIPKVTERLITEEEFNK